MTFDSKESGYPSSVRTPLPTAVVPSDNPPLNSHSFIAGSTSAQIQEKLSREVQGVIEKHFKTDHHYCFLSIYATKRSISPEDADQVFRALQAENPEKTKDILLFLVSDGGYIEPAYQIAKLCKAYSHRSFQVTIPRRAKSAATLVAIGADRIHMGPLSELGPIDPQFYGLPALGVRRSLEIIASICDKYPNSSRLFCEYFQDQLPIEQIGYCDRISESAVQYAERLLKKKPQIPEGSIRQTAEQLVYEYKDHGFVIDVEEAQTRLGSSWVVADTPEAKFGEDIYQLLSGLNVMLHAIKNEKLSVVGSLLKDSIVRAEKE